MLNEMVKKAFFKELKEKIKENPGEFTKKLMAGALIGGTAGLAIGLGTGLLTAKKMAETLSAAHFAELFKLNPKLKDTITDAEIQRFFAPAYKKSLFLNIVGPGYAGSNIGAFLGTKNFMEQKGQKYA